ncbi:MAG: lysophospholipid acyltransferase family protein [Planctomycetota bacterium]
MRRTSDADAAALPSPGTSVAWPIARQAIDGARKGPLAWCEALLARGALAGLRRLPMPVFDPAVALLARAGRRLDRRHADAARRFLETALGPLEGKEREARVLTAFEHFLRVTVEADQVMRMSEAERRERISFEVPDVVRDLVASGSGCLLTTAHLGNWEVAAAAMPLIGFRSVYVVGKPPKNHYLARDLQDLRERLGVRLLPRRGAMEAGPTILKAGGSLGLLLDQRARKRPVLADYFGRPARCDRSAGVLIRRLGVPLVFVFGYRTEEPLRWRVEIPTVLGPETFAGLGPSEIAARVNAEYERAIRARPEQYFWLHDRFKDTPPADEGREA